MAFLPSTQDQTQQTQQQNQVPSVPQIPTLQGSSGPTASSSSGTQGVTNTASPAAAPTTPWQNITSYLSANAGQAGNVADVISGNLQGQYNQASQGIQQAQQNFGQQIEGARNPLNQDVASRAASAPGQFVQNPNDVTAFQKMLNGQYQGPQSFSGSQDYSALQSQVQNAQKQASLVNGGTEGLMTLLQQAESAQGRNPTQGITALDSLLLQEDPSNFGKLSAAASPFAGLTGYLSSTQQGLDTAAQNAAKEAAATQSQLHGQFMGPGGVAPTMQQKLNDELQGASKQATDYNSQISNIIASLNSGKAMSPDVLGKFDPGGALQALNPYGMSSGVYQNILAEGFPGFQPGMLSQYYTSPGQISQPGLQNVMSPQEFADANALNQLLGQDAVGVPQQLGGKFSVPTDFGSFNDKQSIQDIYDQLESYSNVGGALSKMSPEQQNAWLGDTQRLASWLGMPSTMYPNPTPLPATPPPDSGPPYVAPPTTPIGGGDSSGHHTPGI